MSWVASLLSGGWRVLRMVGVLGCGMVMVGCGGFGFVGGGTVVGPMPLKVGELREDSVELGVPLVYQRKSTGGWRSPVEVRIRVLLTRPVDVPLPIEPNGVVVGLRVRW